MILPPQRSGSCHKRNHFRDVFPCQFSAFLLVESSIEPALLAPQRRETVEALEMFLEYTSEIESTFFPTKRHATIFNKLISLFFYDFYFTCLEFKRN